jgi:hypothetical protein
LNKKIKKNNMDNLKGFNDYNDEEQYVEGDRIELIYTDDIYTDLKPGDQGTVLFIDGIGNIHIKWDNGSGLAMIPGIDKIKKVE